MNAAEREAKRLTFAKRLAETGNASLAYREAYPESKLNDKSLPSIATRLANHPKIKTLVEQILQGCRVQFAFLAPDAVERLELLAANAGSEKVRLEANKEILDRAGLKPPEQVQLSTIGVFGGASLDEIREAIKKNLMAIWEKHDESAIDVTPEQGADATT